MSLLIIALLVATPPVVVLVAWALWLLFNCLIAKWCGAAGLKATPPIAIAFRPREWAPLVPRQLISRLISAFTRGSPR